jgi:hypothetical protein
VPHQHFASKSKTEKTLEVTPGVTGIGVEKGPFFLVLDRAENRHDSIAEAMEPDDLLSLIAKDHFFLKQIAPQPAINVVFHNSSAAHLPM